MSDRNRPLILGDALRALPLAGPERDGWARLAAELAPARAPARQRFVLPAAIAASVIALVAATLLFKTPTQQSTIATVAPVPASTGTNGANGTSANVHNAASPDELAALQTRSEALERWLRDTRDAAAPLPGQDLAAAAEIENLIGLVDVQLADTHADTAPLWRQRVNLLEDLTALRYSNYRLAGTIATSNGEALNRIN